MKAIVYTEYGGPEVLRLDEVDRPRPAGDEVLVRVLAASANPGDWHLLRGRPLLIRLAGFGLWAPKNTILGVDVAGRVEAVGPEVQAFHPGDAVFGSLAEQGFGAFAEYACASEDAFVPKPERLSFEEAAAVPSSGLTALQGLRDTGQIQAGQHVLVNGASGGVGTFAVQIAKAFGAEVTGVCSTRNLDWVRALGADHVIDYTTTDFTQGQAHYDLILDTAGYRPLWDHYRALRPQGRYVFVGGSGAHIVQALLLGALISAAGRKKMGPMFMRPDRGDLAVLKELIDQGQVGPVIGRRYALDAVPDALRYLEDGHTQGKVVITVGG